MIKMYIKHFFSAPPFQVQPPTTRERYRKNNDFLMYLNKIHKKAHVYLYHFQLI